ncbi:uncharacterized protein Z518_02611 [Rhinocladiella mackenziei CBS 650.93]|uniref:Rhinocladiella mackenziei CBS 650.93 unplaced genomic scaffold supercont1.2, whole genome shotgun sequence n=1 Tax=Rhinocladiella mackenziei CBS 650.93 TaxID=1442369 RepID=A0A0D2G098_9EURO|nr:uncharacterized protein Z518_02611 [Rhinocladiella mackenziei CBS 650.93]KIX07957.1 hypothetical protein Z518_02611 [Rhinocladiella mackenziei CBS 650.93]
MSNLEIRRGDFLYRDNFFVDLGENKCHPRASISILQDLLFPGAVNPVTKDQVDHWYEAQLIHYGLPQSKDKDTAKACLTNAITSNTLAVPSYLMQMEADMKNEYVSAARKARTAATKMQSATSTSATVTTNGKKRKAEDDSVGGSMTTVSLKVGDVNLDIGHQSVTATIVGAGENKKKKVGESAPVKKLTSRPRVTTDPVPAVKAKSANESTGASTGSPIRPSAFSSQSTSPTTASWPRKILAGRRGRLFPSPSSRISPNTNNPRRFSGETPASFCNYNNKNNRDKDIEMVDAPPPCDPIDFTHQLYSPSPSPSRIGMILIPGTFAIRAYVPNESFPIHASLTLRIDKVHNTLWGRFNIGSRTGIIRMDDTSGLARGDTVSFGWRAEDTNASCQTRYKFGRGCNGSMEFDGRGGVRGRFFGLVYVQDVEFEGTMENEDDALEAEELKYQWDEFLRLAYGMA